MVGCGDIERAASADRERGFRIYRRRSPCVVAVLVVVNISDAAVVDGVCTAVAEDYHDLVSRYYLNGGGIGTADRHTIKAELYLFVLPDIYDQLTVCQTAVYQIIAACLDRHARAVDFDSIRCAVCSVLR